MNKRNLYEIFDKYIKNYDFINQKGHEEYYKWRIAQEFQQFDIEADNIVSMLSKMNKISFNLINGSQRRPFDGIVQFAKREPETVRKMFRDLFADECMAIEQKQMKIQSFVDKSEELRNKYFPESRMYVNDHRTVMQYLFLRYPNENYCYKATQAKSFADAIEYYDDWGTDKNINLAKYYKMCDYVLKEIDLVPELKELHNNLYEKNPDKYYADEKFHILLWDIIYCSQYYDFYNGMTFNPATSEMRKLEQERRKKAKELSDALNRAEEDGKLLNEAIECFSKMFTEGVVVKVGFLGKGTIVKEYDNEYVSIKYAKNNEIKIVNLLTVISTGALKCEMKDYNEKLVKYCDVIKNRSNIPKNIDRARADIEPYLEYLE